MDVLEDLARLAEEAARAAGELLRDGVRGRRDEILTKTSATDMVSEMDHASEALIVERLLGARPDDAILAEEGSSRDGNSNVRWVIDPLDGTTDYLYGHPAWTVSIAAEVDGELAVGVVADPCLNEVFTAWKGGGAFLNGRRLHHSGKDDISTALVATGFAYIPERRAEQAEVLTRVLPAVRDIRRHGVASRDLCWVACARVDAYYEVGLQPWDVAAGAVIATEADAVVLAADGSPFDMCEGSVLAAPPALVDPLLGLLRRPS